MIELLNTHTPAPLLALGEGQRGVQLADEGAVLMVVGMAVVFMALIVLFFLVEGIKTAVAEKPKPTPTPAPSPGPGLHSGSAQAGSPAAPPAPGAPDAISPERVAVITAAAVAVLKKRVRVTRVTRMGRPAGQQWKQQGRRSLVSGHRPQRY